MTTSVPGSALALLLLAGIAAAPQDPERATLDFAGKTIPPDWHLAAKSHRLLDGELVVEGGGTLDWSQPLQDKATVTLAVRSEEKANVEVHLLDDRGEVRYAFAFLGQFHPALERVACAILRDNRFVHVNPRLWLYPGRKFELEVRRAKNQFQMFVDGELAGVFVDPQPVAGKELKLRIAWATEGERDKVHLDDVKVAFPR